MPRLQIIIASTRPGRAGLPIGQWVNEIATHHGGFEVELVDLAEVNLPFLDEPNHPILRQYTKPHTLAWSARIDSADSFIFVTPEYNYSMPATLLNALDFLSHEWRRKPVGFVSYGGMSGGTRAVQMARMVVTSLTMVPTMSTVAIPFVKNFLKDGIFEPNEAMLKSAHAMLDELRELEGALTPLRRAALAGQRLAAGQPI